MHPHPRHLPNAASRLAPACRLWDLLHGCCGAYAGGWLLMLVVACLVVGVCVPLVLVLTAAVSRSVVGAWLGVPVWRLGSSRAWLVSLARGPVVPVFSGSDWDEFERLLAGGMVSAPRREPARPVRPADGDVREAFRLGAVADAVSWRSRVSRVLSLVWVRRVVPVAAAVVLGGVLLWVSSGPVPGLGSPAGVLLARVAGPSALTMSVQGVVAQASVRAADVPAVLERAVAEGFVLDCPLDAGADVLACTGRFDGLRLSFAAQGSGGLATVTVERPEGRASAG